MLSVSNKDVVTSVDQNESYLTYFPVKGCYLFVLFLLVVKGETINYGFQTVGQMCTLSNIHYLFVPSHCPIG